MHDTDGLIALAREAVGVALVMLRRAGASAAEHTFAADMPREVKAAGDTLLDAEILRRLSSTGIPMLSEEAGEVPGSGRESADGAALRWVIDPLDGTVNFVRNLAPCAVSVALFRGDSPVFGVIGEYPSNKIAWGGAAIGAFIDGTPMRVSATTNMARAVLCTGFPARFDFAGDGGEFMRRAGSFGKVRMLGAAALSLLRVASGSADAYAEDGIMLWDAGAGVALVEGAGGEVRMSPGMRRHSYNIFASNGRLEPS